MTCGTTISLLLYFNCLLLLSCTLYAVGLCPNVGLQMENKEYRLSISASLCLSINLFFSLHLCVSYIHSSVHPFIDFFLTSIHAPIQVYNFAVTFIIYHSSFVHSYHPSLPSTFVSAPRPSAHSSLHPSIIHRCASHSSNHPYIHIISIYIICLMVYASILEGIIPD